jgi:phosphoribosylformylglycinamidine synthase subunit PurS
VTREFLVEVFISLKEVVNDPQGLAILAGLHNLGFEGVKGVRTGKYLRLTINAASAEEAEVMAGDACEKLLANTVIEEYTLTVSELVKS